jgi:putative nucleotidyltransferase with HDIG domain
MSADEESPKPTLGKVRAYILRMAGLSTTAIKVLRTCNQPNACANDLYRVISLDPVLTGRVLQLINSAYYALPSKVNSLTRAIILLGINTVKNLVLSFAVFETFSRRDSFRVFTADDFWAHSLVVAAGAKLLAVNRGVQMSEREDFFVSGLLHDIGKIPLNQLFPDAYRSATRLAADSEGGMRACETAAIGFDHCTVGGLIARKWQLSDVLAQVLSGHHDPGGGEGPPALLLESVAIADMLAHEMGAGLAAGSGSLEPAERARLLAGWDLGPDGLSGLAASVEGEVEKARIFLEIANTR